MATQGEKIDKILEDVGEIKSSVAIITEWKKTCDLDVQSHEKILRGRNGDTIGLVAEVDSLKKWRVATVALMSLVAGAVIVDVVMRVITHVY